MLWMETFCFYCSVRLGVIISASFSLFQALVLVFILAFYGTSILAPTKNFINKNEQQNQDALTLKIIDEISRHPLTYTIIFNLFCILHALTSTSAIYAAVKLQKMYLVPYIWSQFVQFVVSFGLHVIGMIILKKVVNLGILIGLTLAGGFYILYLGYSWAGAVALFQIIILVNSQKYKALYGEDYMNPRERNNGSKENVNILKTNYNNNPLPGNIKQKWLIDEQTKQPQWQYGGKIISVIPLDEQEKDDVELIHFKNWHWNELVGMKKGVN